MHRHLPPPSPTATVLRRDRADKHLPRGMRTPRRPSLLAPEAVDWLRFFFFQAEDGIRDLYVTGVQTCALPICASTRITVSESAACGTSRASNQIALSSRASSAARTSGSFARAARAPASTGSVRSEERRVGKEWRCAWRPSIEKTETRGHRRGTK